MAVLRKINWGTYLIAFIISALIFSTGLLLGVQTVQYINAGLEGELRSLQLRTTELELLLLLNQGQGNSTSLCTFYESQLADFDVQTTSFGQKIDAIEVSRGRGDAAVQDLKHEYLLMQVRDFLLVQKINEQCPIEINTILFFYADEGCPDCARQGEIGPPLKAEQPHVMIYAFDTDLGLSVVTALERIYGVKGYPSLVVNGELYEGYRSKDEVASYLR